MGYSAPSTGKNWIDKIGWPWVGAVVGEATLLAVAFGVDLSGEQVATINGFVAAVVAFVTRKKVTPWKPDRHADWSAYKLAQEAEKLDPEDE